MSLWQITWEFYKTYKNCCLDLVMLAIVDAQLLKETIAMNKQAMFQKYEK